MSQKTKVFRWVMPACETGDRRQHKGCPGKQGFPDCPDRIVCTCNCHHEGRYKDVNVRF